MSVNTYTVSQVNRYAGNLLAQDFLLHGICVKGEVSNCKYHTSGHIYFTLKDEQAAIAAVMFAASRAGLAFAMKEGDRVLVTGSVELFERDGRYRLYAREIEKDGEGSLFLKFEALKRELAEMGMFADAYKQAIPRYVRTLGIVTAPSGAAIRDIITVAGRRNPYAQLILYPAKVQGDGAAESIVNGIRALDALGPDVILIGRGGGSIEDLWAFNEEIVARAVFECQTPVISAVGHETDTTIADFVADLRAPTPSAGAELAICDIFELQNEMEHLRSRLLHLMERHRDSARGRLAVLEAALYVNSPKGSLNQKRQYALSLEEKLTQAAMGRLAEYKYRLGILAGRFDGISPAKKLQQGLAFVTDERGMRVSTAFGISPGDGIRVRLWDGTIRAAVTAVEAAGHEERK